MKTHKVNFYIVTGGPGSGKTTLIDALRQHGFLCVAEVARAIIKEQVRIGGNALHRGDRALFRELMLSRSIYTFEQMAQQTCPVFFDRGIPELVGYGNVAESGTTAYVLKAVELFRYNAKVFIAPPWAEIYCKDQERTHTFEEAVDSYAKTADAYKQSRYQLVEIPKGTVKERLDFILNVTKNIKSPKD